MLQIVGLNKRLATVWKWITRRLTVLRRIDIEFFRGAMSRGWGDGGLRLLAAERRCLGRLLKKVLLAGPRPLVALLVILQPGIESVIFKCLADATHTKDKTPDSPVKTQCV